MVSYFKRNYIFQKSKIQSRDETEQADQSRQIWGEVVEPIEA